MSSLGDIFGDLMRERPALWLGLRQAEALRESLNLSLSGLLLQRSRGALRISEDDGGRETVKRWLKSQGIDGAEWIMQAMEQAFEKGVGVHPSYLVRSIDAPSSDWVNKGADRSGAGYQDPENFVITSAFVRLLGASEQYELDVLKSLLYYRPHGLLGHPTDSEQQLATHDVIDEIPQAEKGKSEARFFSKPPLWTWVRKQAENNNERDRIFKNVYGILTHEKTFNKQKQDWYEKRNAIAHGREGVRMSLKEYMEVDVFVAKSMLFLSGQCQARHKLVL